MEGGKGRENDIINYNLKKQRIIKSQLVGQVVLLNYFDTM